MISARPSSVADLLEGVLIVPIYAHMDKTDELKAEVERLHNLVPALRKEMDHQVRELREEKHRALELVDQMREQIEAADALIESWIEAFEKEQDDSGVPARTNEILAHGRTLIKTAKGLEA
jgi:hypothetical protein